MSKFVVVEIFGLKEIILIIQFIRQLRKGIQKIEREAV